MQTFVCFMKDKMATNPENLSIELSEMFSGPVAVDPLEEHHNDGMDITVCEFEYSVEGGSETPDTHYRQTAVVLTSEDLELPKFSLSPKPKGVFRLLRSLVGGFGALEFADTPEFSKLYDVHGWSETPVRILFIKSIRDHFTNQPGWSVRGFGKRMIIFKQSKIYAAKDREGFVGDALEIMQLFRDGEEALDAQPDVRRQTDAADILATTDRMGGFVGGSLRRQLEKFMTSPGELQMFASSAAPRRIPASIKRQVMGDNFPLIPVGLLFVVVGIVAGVSFLMFGEGKMAAMMGLPFLFVFPVVGGLMSGLTFVHRRNKGRLLKHGIMTSGTITEVTNSGSVNHQQTEHKVKLQYQRDGKMIPAGCKAVSLGATQAQQLAESGDQVRILVDPENPEHVCCLELLVIKR